MTDIAQIAAGQAFPTKAEFHCAPYSDGSGHQVKIGYDTSDERFGGHVLIDDWSITFEAEHADEVCAAIQAAATAIRSRAHLAERAE